MLEIYNNCKALKTRNLSEDQIKLINQIDYEVKDQTWLIGKITEYVHNNYPLEIFVKNYKEIRKLGRDSSSIKSYILRFGEMQGSALHKEKTKSSTVTQEHMISKLGKVSTDEFYRKRGATLENFIDRHGIELGNSKWDEYLSKRKLAYVNKRTSGHIYPTYNLDYFTKLHGEEKGSRVYYQKINSQRHKVSLAYYIEQFGPIDGPIRCRKAKDHASLEYFIEKHGDNEGKILYNKRCVSMAECTKNSNRYSNMSKRLFDEVKKQIPDLFYYGENEMVWAASGVLADTQRAVCPDLFYKGKIIEFNGDVFHANPALFDKDDTSHPFNKKITASQIWSKDAIRLDYYKSKGYAVLEIWELDFKQQPKETINKCIQFLMN